MLYGCLSIQFFWECFCNQVSVILTSPLMGDFVKENHLGVWECTSTLDALITGFIDDAVQFAFEVLGVLQHLLLLDFVVGVVKRNQPVGIDGVAEVLANELPDASF